MLPAFSNYDYLATKSTKGTEILLCFCAFVYKSLFVLKSLAVDFSWDEQYPRNVRINNRSRAFLVVFVDVIYCDNQIPIGSRETDRRYQLVFSPSKAKPSIVYFVPRRIVFMSSYNLSVQHCLFNIKDIEIVFRHLFDGVNGHIIVS